MLRKEASLVPWGPVQTTPQKETLRDNYSGGGGGVSSNISYSDMSVYKHTFRRIFYTGERLLLLL